MIGAISESDVIMVLLGLIQLIVVGLGAWILKTLIDLKVIMTEMRTILESNGRRIHNLEEFRQFAESKIKELWSWYKREFLDSKNRPPHS